MNEYEYWHYMSVLIEQLIDQSDAPKESTCKNVLKLAKKTKKKADSICKQIIAEEKEAQMSTLYTE